MAEDGGASTTPPPLRGWGLLLATATVALPAAPGTRWLHRYVGRPPAASSASASASASDLSPPERLAHAAAFSVAMMALAAACLPAAALLREAVGSEATGSAGAASGGGGGGTDGPARADAVAAGLCWASAGLLLLLGRVRRRARLRSALVRAEAIRTGIAGNDDDDYDDDDDDDDDDAAGGTGWYGSIATRPAIAEEGSVAPYGPVVPQGTGTGPLRAMALTAREGGATFGYLPAVLLGGGSGTFTSRELLAGTLLASLLLLVLVGMHHLPHVRTVVRCLEGAVPLYGVAAAYAAWFTLGLFVDLGGDVLRWGG